MQHSASHHHTANTHEHFPILKALNILHKITRRQRGVPENSRSLAIAMQQASGSAESQSQFWTTFWAMHAQREAAPANNWVIIEGSEWALNINNIPETTHPDFELHNDCSFIRLSQQNLALHELQHGNARWKPKRGSVIWNLDAERYSQSTNEVVVHGEPVMPAYRQNAYCHCGRCNWIWFLRGWECWPNPYIIDIG